MFSYIADFKKICKKHNQRSHRSINVHHMLLIRKWSLKLLKENILFLFKKETVNQVYAIVQGTLWDLGISKGMFVIVRVMSHQWTKSHSCHWRSYVDQSSRLQVLLESNFKFMWSKLAAKILFCFRILGSTCCVHKHIFGCRLIWTRFHKARAR